MMEYNYGYIKIKLDSLLKERGISKNKLAHRAVLARICTALDCRIEDLLEFVPAAKES